MLGLLFSFLNKSYKAEIGMIDTHIEDDRNFHKSVLPQH